MTKKNKILIISASLIIAIIVIIVIVLICNEDKEEKGNGDLPLGGDNYMEVFEGKILEIKDENVIVVEVTETATNLLNNGDKITMKVGEVDAELHHRNRENEDVSDIYEMQIGDVVGTQFWKEDFEITDDGYYLDLDKIGSDLDVDFEDFENRKFIDWEAWRNEYN